MRVIVHYGRTISLETVKLLGTPFTWGGCRVACRLVRQDDGTYKVLCRDLGDPQSLWKDDAAYVTLEGVHSSVFLEDADGIVWPVTFDDEIQP